MYKYQSTKLVIAGLCTLFLWGVPLPVDATVGTGTDTKINYTMNYPIAYTTNQISQDAINSDIYTYIANFRAAYERGDFVQGTFSYKVKYEDDKFLSLIINDYRWYGGPIHGTSHYISLNYNKETGEKLPLSYFVKLEPSDIRQIFSLTIYDDKDTAIPYKYLIHSNHQLTSDYYLLGNGEIALLYQPYALAAYSFGATYIKLTAQWIDYFNRHNQAQ